MQFFTFPTKIKFRKREYWITESLYDSPSPLWFSKRNKVRLWPTRKFVFPFYLEIWAFLQIKSIEERKIFRFFLILEMNNALETENEGVNPQPKQKGINKFLHAIDIFAFLPVPKTEEVSTKRSVIGSISLIVIFLGYLIFSLVQFFTNNPPRIN